MFNGIFTIKREIHHINTTMEVHQEVSEMNVPFLPPSLPPYLPPSFPIHPSLPFYSTSLSPPYLPPSFPIHPSLPFYSTSLSPSLLTSLLSHPSFPIQPSLPFYSTSHSAYLSSHVAFLPSLLPLCFSTFLSFHSFLSFLPSLAFSFPSSPLSSSPALLPSFLSYSLHLTLNIFLPFPPSHPSHLPSCSSPFLFSFLLCLYSIPLSKTLLPPSLSPSSISFLSLFLPPFHPLLLSCSSSLLTFFCSFYFPTRLFPLQLL